ncbi:uncharacterized protein Z519_05193 [Cladophialophora bantiana CBS 173.52]|uniref:Major facilitator superfamily (MFS) profile domain-containing protein n=1 Tax=Cladophialophora bantiana (strain ATCC 10958 / CBS 173.52 / CDC B-1940 / NIH 8579) TaxID=1442370 RepID=A0A0D2HKS1_CLAB1|nr:uncharacterized protein Z519_05193 [Cladophialophora bantiana CBS 173.52]KIW93878.1 hypothetical protein Z519_05193 [Cladophialophora bantiana CBS 173.52]
MVDAIAGSDMKKEAEHHALEHLEKVDSKDSLHRNDLGQDATTLRGYWASPRLLGSILASFLLANSIYIGYAMPVSILSVMNVDIGPSPNIYLVSLVYTLFTGVLHLFFARLSDILGRRYFLVGGQTFGVIGSIICATGNSINVLIGGSVLAGIGGAAGLLYPVVIHELLPNKHRPWGQAAITLAVLPTLGFGPAIARTMIAQTAVGWRGVYWLNVAVSGASVVLFATCYFPPNFHMINSELTKWQEVKALDYGGLLLYFGGLILVLMGFTWAQGTYAWQSAHVLGSLIVGTVTLVAFGIYETYMPLKQPLLPVRLFKIPNITACIFVGSTMQMVWLALNVFWPIQISVLFTSNEVTIGLLSCTTGIALAAGELIFAPIFRAVGYLKWQMVVASLMTAVFGTAMAAVTHKTENMGIAFTVLAGLAVGWIEMVTIVVTGLVAPPNDIGVAQGFFGSTRLTFGTVAVSIYLAIYSNRLTAFLPQEIVPAVLSAGLPASSIPDLFMAITNGTAAALEEVPRMTDGVLDAVALATKLAYAHAFKIVYLATLAFTGIGLVSAFFITDVDAFLTNYVNKTIRKPKVGSSDKAEV